MKLLTRTNVKAQVILGDRHLCIREERGKVTGIRELGNKNYSVVGRRDVC